MAQPVRFPYTPAGTTEARLMPRLPLTLNYEQRSIEIVGLLDTGAAVNVLPYSAGAALGAEWDQQATVISLTGTVGSVEARALVVWAALSHLRFQHPVRLVFAWTRSDETPILLGQTTFFMEFDVCFFRSQAAFEIRPKDG